MKKIFVVLAILFIGILLAGCTSQPPAPVATPTPVPTTVVTTVPTVNVTSVPTANITPNKTATPTPTPTPQPSVTITFTSSMTITPGTTVRVPVGGKVIWKNNDQFYQHGIQSTSFGSMESIPYGKTFEVTFAKVGTFDYTTTFQPQTSGQIIVTK
jgi:plastocyanin